MLVTAIPVWHLFVQHGEEAFLLFPTARGVLYPWIHNSNMITQCSSTEPFAFIYYNSVFIRTQQLCVENDYAQGESCCSQTSVCALPVAGSTEAAALTEETTSDPTSVTYCHNVEAGETPHHNCSAPCQKSFRLKNHAGEVNAFGMRISVRLGKMTCLACSGDLRHHYTDDDESLCGEDDSDYVQADGDDGCAMMTWGC